MHLLQSPAASDVVGVFRLCDEMGRPQIFGAKTPTQNTSKDAVLCEDVPFRGLKTKI